MRFSWEGLVPYQTALELQRLSHAEILRGSEDHVIGLEHPSVITLGVRGERTSDIKAFTLPVVETDRGGQATLHSPGQLVIYPLVDLKRSQWSVRDFVHALLQTTTAVLKESGIDGEIRDDRTGVFTSKGKIAFCGLRIEQGVTRHGIALNVSNDLSLFQNIRPCGFAQEKITSWSEFSKAPSIDWIFDRWAAQFEILRCQRFGLEDSPARESFPVNDMRTPIA